MKHRERFQHKHSLLIRYSHLLQAIPAQLKSLNITLRRWPTRLQYGLSGAGPNFGELEQHRQKA